MQSLASPDSCFVTASTAALVSGYFTLEDLGDFQVKGVAHPVRVHRLDGVGVSRTRLDVSRARGFSRFVGRGDEMHVLESALTRARQGAAQVVGIVGDAGLGKSRLSFEFLERCRAQGLMTYETTGVAHGKATPLVPMLKLFKAFFGITDLDSATTARERIARRLLLLDEGLRESLPLNFDFLGYPDPENPAPNMDAETRQRQMFNIVRRVMQARGQKETGVTLLEDLHWFDSASAAYLEPMIEAAAGTRSLIILNFRPEFHAPWMGKSYYLQLPLGPLVADAIRELLDALLGNDSSIKGLAEAIHARTAGNPFFTEEVVQNLIETGKLQGAKGHYKLVTPVSKLEVPSSVHALLAARIDRLAEREKDVLQTAAVIGKEFDKPTLAAVVEQDAPQLREALQKLKDTEFVYEQSLYPVTEYTFKHPLTQEVALASQLQEKRKKLHAAVAQVIEAAHTSDLDQQAALIAHHWEQSGDLAQAVRWHRRAAEWASTRDPVEGVRHWVKVRGLGRSLADDAAKDSRLRACSAILMSSWRLGMSSDEVDECLVEVRALAKELGRPNALATALGGYAAHLGVSGRGEAALEVAQEAKSMLDDSVTLGERIMFEGGPAYWLNVAGRLPLALEGFERVVQLTGGDPNAGRDVAGYSPLLWAYQQIAYALLQMGRSDEAWPHAERAIRMAREQNAKENLVFGLAIVSFGSYFTGGSASPLADALQAAAEAIEVAEVTGARYVQLLAQNAFALAHFVKGDFAACEELVIGALTQAKEAGTGLDMQGFLFAVIADCCLARGDAAAAIARAREGIEAAEFGGAWFQMVLNRVVLADALIRAGAPEAAVNAEISAARELVRKSSGNSLLPRLREAEARLAGRNDRAALKAGLREAEAMWRSMGMPDPAARLGKELASLN